MSYKIAIIGMGASGTLILRELSQQLPNNCAVEITIFEKTKVIGPGVTYGADTNDDIFILNMRSWLLGANKNNIREFYEWLAENNIDGGDTAPYFPRQVYGKYLQHIVDVALEKLRANNISVTIVNAEIVDIECQQDDYKLSASNGRKYVTQSAILALGHLPTSPSVANSKYIIDPYHNLEKIRSIDKNSTVGILGTKLTAVDVAIYLRKLGIEKIHMFSKSGLLPETQQEHNPKAAPVVKFMQPGKYSLAAFFRAYRTQTSKTLNQPMLDTSKHFIDKYWEKLSKFHKKLFLNKYRGWWMAHRHPMPACNTKRINDLVAENTLVIHQQYKGISFKPDQGAFNVDLKAKHIFVDYIIDATGSSSTARSLDSKLVQNLLNKNILTSCEFGGINIHCDTMQVENFANLYAIGHLTHGRLFYVASMERLLVHASIIAKCICINMISVEDNKLVC